MTNSSYYYPYGRIQHYYGDHVRALFVGLAILVGLYMTLNWDVNVTVAVEIPSVIVLVILAGLTNPRSKAVMLADAAVAIVGVALSQWHAVIEYSAQAYMQFATLECIGIGFLLALYFSVKTVRSMEEGKIGSRDR